METSEKRTLKDLEGKNIVVYDLEIKKPIDECEKGWGGHDEMGISVGCAFDYLDMRYRVFMDDNLHHLVERLNRRDTLIVAFNNINFDNKLLRATPNKGDVKFVEDTELNNYDMFKVSQEGAMGSCRPQKGFKLDDHLRALGMELKSGHGADAPLWWKSGLVGKVVDYCLDDVRLEKKLFEDMYVTGTTASAYNPNRYEIKLPIFQ